MKEIEIVDLPPLAPNERSLLNLHSLLNVLNVLRGELALIGLELAGNDELLKDALRTCDQFVAGLREPQEAMAGIRTLAQHQSTIMAAIEAELNQRPGQRDMPEIVESLGNLRSVFAILDTRARELLAREQTPDAWVSHSLADLHRNFVEVFAAIERNSHGRFRIIYNAALQSTPDYYVDFKLESVDAPTVTMPAVFQDVMRDLIANARKYTAPGGRITAALHCGSDALRFFVEDTGRGIPENEIASVVEFGKRASNVADVRTMGGGFGLTKAFFVTKQFGGRFWIGSRIGIGTRVRIFVPRPAGAAGRAA